MAEIPDTMDMAENLIGDAVETQDTGSIHPRWHRHVAMTTLVMALVTAVGAMLASMSANQSLIERTQEIIEVNRLEGQRINMEILNTQYDILTALGESTNQVQRESIDVMEGDIQRLENLSAGEETIVLIDVEIHHIFAISVILLSMGTALCGLSVIVNRKYLWVSGLIFGVLGSLVVLMGVARMLT